MFLAQVLDIPFPQEAVVFTLQPASLVLRKERDESFFPLLSLTSKQKTPEYQKQLLWQLVSSRVNTAASTHSGSQAGVFLT